MACERTDAIPLHGAPHATLSIERKSETFVIFAIYLPQ
jgi:hypothetical protein